MSSVAEADAEGVLSELEESSSLELQAVRPRDRTMAAAAAAERRWIKRFMMVPLNQEVTVSWSHSGPRANRMGPIT